MRKSTVPPLDPAHAAALDRFCGQIRDGRAVILAGAGVSMPAPSNRPSWPKLIEQMATFASKYSTNAQAMISEFASGGQLLAAADIFVTGNKIPKPARASFFKAVFDTTPAQVPDLCRELASLHVQTILTTNFDNNLKYALEGQHAQVYTNYASELEAALSFINSYKMLVHLHGRVAVYDTLVYTTDSYRKNNELEPLKLLLRLVLTQCSVLAIGFSFMDPPFQDLLRFIATELNGNTSQSHLAILPSSSPADKDLLAQSGFEYLLYDDHHGHDFPLRCVRRLRACEPASSSPPPMIDSLGNEDMSALVSAFLSLTNPDRGSTFDTAAASIVLAELAAGPLSRDALTERVTNRMSMSNSAVNQLIVRGLEYLQAENRINLNGGIYTALGIDSATENREGLIVDAVCTRMISIDPSVKRTSEIESIIRFSVTHIMMAQGMAAARAFINVDSPDWYVLERLIDASVRVSAIKARWKDALRSALSEVLREPNAGVSRELFKLANAAFALESVFLNPHGTELGQALRWTVYLDSNVALRILDASGESGTGFREFLDRLRRLRAPMRVLGPFAEEIVEHLKLVERQLTAAAANTPRLVEELCSAIPRGERSPMLNWYLWGLKRFSWKTFQEFVARERLDSVDALSVRLAKLDIAIEAKDAVKQYDTSERETLWDELRRWRSQDSDSNKGRRLRELKQHRSCTWPILGPRARRHGLFQSTVSSAGL